MTPPKIDLTNPSVVFAEIFDNDEWIKDEFAKHLSSEISQFGEAMAESFKRFPALDKMSAGGNDQAAFVAGFVFGVFDDLVVSMKLLVSGKMVASGNLMRQAIEGIAVAILCASPEPVSVRRRNSIVRVKYWERVKALDRTVNAHLSLDHLELNCEMLHVSRDAIGKLRSARKHYHLFSHPGLIGMASRMDMGEPGPIFIGGNFDKSKLPGYKAEIAERTGLCQILPGLIDGLIVRLDSPGPLGPVVPA
jgi:hypothetical protein